MSKTAVALLCALFLVMTLAIDRHYMAVIDQNYTFTAYLLTQYCPRFPIK